MKSAVLLLAFLVFIAPAAAQNLPDGQFYVSGWGQKSCGDWLADARTDGRDRRNIAYSSWISGFLSGSNSLCARQSDSFNPNAIEAYMDKFCSEHPLSNVTMAVLTRRAELGGPIDESQCGKE